MFFTNLYMYLRGLLVSYESIFWLSMKLTRVRNLIVAGLLPAKASYLITSWLYSAPFTIQ